MALLLVSYLPVLLMLFAILPVGQLVFSFHTIVMGQLPSCSDLWSCVGGGLWRSQDKHGCLGLSIQHHLLGWSIETVSLEVHERGSYHHHHVQTSAQLGGMGTWEMSMLLFDSQSQM